MARMEWDQEMTVTVTRGRAVRTALWLLWSAARHPRTDLGSFTLTIHVEPVKQTSELRSSRAVQVGTEPPA